MFQNKHVLITGAASGIGRALAQYFDEQGAKLSLCDVDGQGLETLKSEIKRPGCIEPFDIAERERLLDYAQRVEKEQGPVDLLMNNAGVALFQSVKEFSYEDMRWLMDINFWGMVNLSQALLPGMLQRNSGTIVNVSSIFGIVGYGCQSAYCASKFAIRGYTEAMQIDLQDTGVKAVLVHPGGVKTKIARSARLSLAETGLKSQDDLCRKFDKAAPTTAEQAARTIGEGLIRGRSRIMVGSDAKKMRTISRLLPDSYARVFELG